jgi:undecaprenyl-diphosphatase
MRTVFDTINHWDARFFNTIFGMDQKKVFVSVMPWISHTANGYYYPAIPVILYLVDPFIAEKFLIAGIIAFAIELPAYKLIKKGVKRPRPFEAIGGINWRVWPSDEFSFPSGHTAAAFVVASLLSYFLPVTALPAIAWAISVGFSRVYLRVHYPTDVFAGIIIGVFSASAGLLVVI